jgi:hypothetical protein
MSGTESDHTREVGGVIMRRFLAGIEQREERESRMTLAMGQAESKGCRCSRYVLAWSNRTSTCLLTDNLGELSIAIMAIGD